MRLAISNIAWSTKERDAAHALLAQLGVQGLEIAPGLAFPDENRPIAPSETVLQGWLGGLARHGLTVVSMQSLLFGAHNAQLFGEAAERTLFEHSIGCMIDLAGRIGCRNLVLGSPGARSIPANMSRDDAETIAIDTLRRLGNRCLTAGCLLALEPNPAAYNTNFLNTLVESVAFARRVDHPAVRVNFDIGALLMNDEVDAALHGLPAFIDLISHVHISEPNLAPAPASIDALTPILAALKTAGYAGAVSIEMRSIGDDNLDRVRTSLLAAKAAMAAAEQIASQP